ncbi:MAG: amidophosphoribosyltransferase [Dehalococcoidia bacterium]|nr:amidophosphoribosyltransferase [Dehalococcoidia bacterium]
MAEVDQTIHDACGVVAVFLPEGDAARVAFFGIFSLQHRGQESAGITTVDSSGEFRNHKALGLVSRVFDEDILAGLPGRLAIGHNRYSTTGSSTVANAQPIRAVGPGGELYLAHNGNVVNAESLRRELLDMGVQFEGTTDSEVIAYLITHASGDTWDERIASAMRRLDGAYSMTIITQDAVYAARDPHGFRPLSYGRLNGGWIVASETCALENVGAKFEREVEPGEIFRIDAGGVSSTIARTARRSLCVFEYIYFSRPDSHLSGERVYLTREAMGAQLARQHPMEADLVTAIPDSAIAAGIGYAREAEIPFAETMVKNRYVGRTFIQPDQRLRDEGVRLKFTPLTEVIKGKRLIVVDDSIVRGTTTERVVNFLRSAGAKEIHLRVCAPPIKYPCHYGIDMPSRAELIASNRSIEETQVILGVDSLGYLDMPGLYSAIGQKMPGFCDACFTGKYPVPVQLELDKFALERM